MSQPTHSSLPSVRPSNLVEAVARARWPRNHATAQLQPHREELLRLCQAGESVGSLVGGLRAMGVEIAHETLRLWLNRELGRKPAKRHRRQKTAKGSRTAAIATSMNPKAQLPIVAPAERIADSPVSPAVPTAPHPSPAPGGANVPVLEGTRFIRPGETPLEAWNRRKAEHVAREAADTAAKAAPSAPSGSHVKDI